MCKAENWISDGVRSWTATNSTISVELVGIKGGDGLTTTYIERHSRIDD